MKMLIIVKEYDSFARNGSNNHEEQFVAEGALNAYNKYKELKAHDFDYDDHYVETRLWRIKGGTNYPYILKPQRPHARTKEDWEEMNQSPFPFFDQEVTEQCDIETHVRDIPFVTKKEEEYFFDHNDYDFGQ